MHRVDILILRYVWKGLNTRNIEIISSVHHWPDLTVMILLLQLAKEDGGIQSW